MYGYGSDIYHLQSTAQIVHNTYIVVGCWLVCWSLEMVMMICEPLKKRHEQDIRHIHIIRKGGKGYFEI